MDCLSSGSRPGNGGDLDSCQERGNIIMAPSPKSRDRGISVLEILIALAVLAVIFSFASASFSHAANSKELMVAAEEVQFSVQGARSMARELETDVVMHLNSGGLHAPDSITFSFPSRKKSLKSDGLLQEFVFPSDIRLASNNANIHFDHRGLVETPVELVLISTLSESLKENLLIQ